MDNYVIYTDGAYSAMRSQGGIGIIILKNGKKIKEFSKMYKNTTNNRMELLAVILGLKLLINADSILIYSDSQYVIGCATLGWKRRVNTDLWEKYDIIFKNHNCKNIIFQHVKGHNGDIYNEECDKLAVFASQLLD